MVSVSGDGGFLQSSMELETAVRPESQRTAPDLGSITATTWWPFRKKKNTSACPASSSGRWILKPMPNPSGAKGFAVESAEALEPTLHAAMDVDGPAVVAIPVDYRDNPLLMGQLHLSQIL
ncbi:thiamine pyrophosphate-dependent enzyme [Klebsiella pneumoniae subsp. pneumoniae]|nr:thiamine pyrophosphate-dependent enzyme [Klebsiella pneumoniae subsp. pneumoniae]